MNRSATTIDPDDVARFSALAAEWWDMQGAICAAAQIHTCPSRRDPGVAERPFHAF